MKQFLQIQNTVYFFLVFLFLNPTGIYAQKAVYANGRQIDLQATDEFLEQPSLQFPVLVYGQISKIERELLSKYDNFLTIGDYVGSDIYMVLLKKPFSDISKIVKSCAPVLAQDKFNDFLSNYSESNQLAVMVNLFKNADKVDLDKFVSHCQAQYAEEQIWTGQNKWIVLVDKSKLAVLASCPSIQYISPKFQDVSLSDGARSLANVYGVSNSYGTWNLAGDSITLGIGDDSYASHLDQKDRANNFNPFYNSGHGDYTCGIMAGNGIINESKRGFAYRANIVSNFFSNIIAYAPVYEQNFNVKATNNSYAAIVSNCGYAGTYDVTSQFCDQLALDNPQILNIFASGNDGAMQCGSFPTRYATVVGSYQAAKNTLVVGMNGKNSDILGGGGAGPTKDGRVKPEITAVGLEVNSTWGNNSYGTASGTSASCPNVAGAAAILQQRYKQLNSGQYPSNALLKAILMNGARDIGNPGPDYFNGFGHLDVKNSIEIIDNARYLTGSINHLGSANHTISVPANMGKLKVMIYWNDAPASPASATTLVNDIDLVVTSPSSSIFLPLILNPDPASVTNNAIQGVDHRNNVEQIVIDNPSSGNYTLNVSGYNIPTGSQSYVIVYTFVDKDLHFIFPTKNDKIETGVTTNIHWSTVESNGDFSLELSTDNGATWNSVATIPADKRFTLLLPPSTIASDQCILKLTNNSGSYTSEQFSIIGRPISSLSVNQCPGNITLEWNAVTGANKYYMYRKVGPEMVLVDSTSNLNYTFSGLNQDTTYWVSVSAGVGQGKSLRALAKSRLPNSGSCTNLAIDGDLSIVEVNNLHSGRLITSSSLGISENMSIVVSNNDNIANNNFQILYKINSGAWQTFTPSSPSIAAAGQTSVLISGLNLNAIGVYDFTIVVKNLDLVDPITQNDTVRISVKQVNNPPINLVNDYVDNFESVPLIYTTNNNFGLSSEERFDFANTMPEGRLRSYVMNEVLIDGNRSMSMDLTKDYKFNLAAVSRNTLTGTFNLSNYNTTSDEIRFEFDYILHDNPNWDSANRVYIRGNDLASWIPLPIFDTSNLGIVQRYGAYSLNDYLIANGQLLSPSTQIMIAQRDHTLIGGKAFGAGLTVDNFKIFKAENDVALIDAQNILTFNCGLNNTIPLTVRVANTMPSNMNNIPIYYQIDNQGIVSEIISSINSKDTIAYTFNQNMDLSAPGKHVLKVWVDYTNDNYAYNDSLLNIEIHNQPYISTFPYLEGFENNDGYYFSSGFNKSWEHGDPTASGINHAANGDKVWKTNISGAYSANEVSYLYSPCFNVNALNNPMLSFSFLYEIESPSGNTFFDSAYMEYSVDGGLNWSKLGANGEGYNWYNYTKNVWAGTDQNYWHVASIPLPKVSNISLRWAMYSDPGVELAGLVIDDIHIFDYINPIFKIDSFMPAPSVTLNTISSFMDGNNIAGIVDPGSTNFGSGTFQSYLHTEYIHPDSQQFYLPRSFTLEAPNYSGTDSVILKLFVKDSLMTVVRNSSQCASCTSHPEDIYQMGVTTFVDPSNPNTVNDTLVDNVFGTVTYIGRDSVDWIPYYDGYYARFKTNQLGEYWFNDGGLTQNYPLPIDLITFTANKINNRSAILKWQNDQDENAFQYQLQVDEGSGFYNISTINSVNNSSFEYSFIDTPSLQLQPYTLYRLMYNDLDGKIFYSPIRKLNWTDLPVNFDVYPNPTQDGKITFSWYNNGEESFEWKLYSVLGQVLDGGVVNQNTFSGSTQINIFKNVQVGNLYVLKVFFNNSIKTYKIIYQTP